MNPSRRNFLAATVLAGCAKRTAVTGCDSLADQTIRWIVPFAPGGGNDLYSRLFEPYFEKTLGTQIAISNEPGGGSLVGLTKLRDAEPDGRTLGILNTPGLLAAALFGQPGYPNPVSDFSIIGRLARTQAAVVTGSASGIRSFNDLYERQKKRPLLCGITGVASNNMLNMAVTARLLDLRLEYIAGFSGNPETQLAAMRGDIDLVSNSYENLQAGVESGDLRVLLQIWDGRISDSPALDGIPWLAGTEGLALRHATEVGHNPEEALALAATLVGVAASGITVAGPTRLPAELLQCLRAAFEATVKTPEFIAAAAAARRPLDVLPGEQTHATIREAAANMMRFGPIVREIFEKVRQ